MNTIAKLRELGRVAHIGGARERPVECMAIVDALPALLAIAEAAKMESDHRNGRGPRLDPEVVYINLDKALTQLDEVEL